MFYFEAFVHESMIFFVNTTFVWAPYPPPFIANTIGVNPGEPAGQPDALNSAASNESVRTGGGHPKEANHRRGGPQRRPTQDTQTTRTLPG